MSSWAAVAVQGAAGHLCGVSPLFLSMSRVMERARPPVAASGSGGARAGAVCASRRERLRAAALACADRRGGREGKAWGWS